jgi:hypothetical protein
MRASRMHTFGLFFKAPSAFASQKAAANAERSFFFIDGKKVVLALLRALLIAPDEEWKSSLRQANVRLSLP